MSKSSNKSSRIAQLSEQLERLLAVEKTSRDLEQLRYVTLKMYQLLQTQDKAKKEMINKICEKAAVLLGLLENCNDTQLMLNILGCCLEISAGGKKCVATLAGHGAVDILLKILKMEISEPSIVEETLVLVHSILARIAPKDRKFALKSRLTGALQITMDVIRQNANNFKVLHPALLVIKISAGSSVNCNVLNKAGFINILFRILSNCGHKRVTTLKLVLDLIAILVKSKGVAAKAVNLSGVEILLRMFYDWHRTDHHNRQTAIRKALLNSMKALVSTRAGKAAFLQSNGMKTLFVLTNDTSEHKEMDGINSVIVQILRLCMPENTLPLTSNRTMITFELPKIIGESASGDDNGSEEVEKDSEEESSPLESEDEDVGVTESQEDSEYISQSRAGPAAAGENTTNKTRSKAELVSMYHQFFQEMTCTRENKEECNSEDTLGRDNSAAIKKPIVIPTAKLDLTSSSSFDHCSNHLADDCCGCEENESPRQDPLCDEEDFLAGGSVSSPKAVSYTTGTHDNKSRPSLRDGIYDIRMKVRSVSEFVKTPSPDVYGHYPPLHPEPLYTKKPGIQRSMLLKDIERVLQDQKVVNKVVYDLNPETDIGPATASNGRECSSDMTRGSTSSIRSDKEQKVNGKRSLSFESRFESGNLRKAIQVCEKEYDLILNSDVNCRSHHQWFYFEVGNMEENVPYKFNIINCEKVNSQFNFGMQPVLYSYKDAEDGDPGWIRTGSDICYYKNHYKRPCSNPKTEREKYYYTLTFTIEFPYSDDRCYLAYHFPYSFSLLENHLLTYEYRLDPEKILYKRQVICDTLTGNPCYLITITSPNSNNDNRPYIFLCSRVHPGESNASWVMKGVLDFLLSNKITARVLREIFIFKIIPMLNPDGVINGCHRCSISGADLNRQWLDPDPILFPTIYHAKGLLLYLQAMNKTPLVFCDFHGHSRKKNVFMYGCHSPTADLPVTIVNSGSESDSSNVGEAAVRETNHRTLPRILHSIAPAFSFQNCSFVVESSKESTARVVVWRELGVTRSYTMESTYCGTDQGPYKGFHIGTKELEEMGRCFCAGLLKLGNGSSITALLGTIPKLSMDERDPEDDILLPDGDLFAPVDTYPYEGRDYATQLLV
ncbi:cytosolic carboxypeptidase 1-like isoform X2 [Dendronephthya gigantea]|uniref:cytosolic carboxypeptidase 1-like isoform X2 n=1 Tax=Dendronephthya gigantea TaxID=151771 RepID=UPI001068DE51|nr:cytosolic carboxypeptidase 1-like isoform X2 [Dendronephthya gigantea]